MGLAEPVGVSGTSRTCGRRELVGLAEPVGVGGLSEPVGGGGASSTCGSWWG